MLSPNLPKRVPSVIAGACLVLALAGCDEGVPTHPAPEVEAAQAAAPAPTATADVVPLSDMASTVGTSQLARTPNGVSYRVSTTSLEPGHAYTLWIVVFNDPAGCTGGPPCGMDDIVNPDARPDMMFAGGNVVGSAGRATFAGRRSVGDGSGSANGPAGVPAHGLEDPAGAEIWFVVHDHGPRLAHYFPDMIQTIDGGCTDAGVPEAGAASPWNDHHEPGVGAFGRRGPNTCASVQLAVHDP